MRLLFSSDLHGHQQAFERFTEELRSGSYDLGVLGGDLVDEWMPNEDALKLTGEGPDALVDDLGGEGDDPIAVWNNSPARALQDRALRVKIAGLQNLLASAEKPIFFILGNHDRMAWPDTALMTNLHGKSVSFQGRRFVGYRWTNLDRMPVDLKTDQENLIPLVDRDTILVTHAPPQGILDGTRRWGEGYGLKTLCAFRPKPWLHLVGHVHSDAGRYGRYVNGAWPTVRRFFAIDVESKSVRRVGAP